MQNSMMSKVKVLIVEDEAVIALEIENNLQRFGSYRDLNC